MYEVLDEAEERFSKDLARSKEIGNARVKMFDAGDGSSAGPHSRQLWKEYQNLRNKYGRNSTEGMRIFNAYNAGWDN